MSQSVERGEPVRLERIDTIADGLAAPFAGRLNLAHVQAFVDLMLVVPDRDIVAALGVLLERCKIVPEPAGAAAVAPLLNGALKTEAGHQRRVHHLRRQHRPRAPQIPSLTSGLYPRSSSSFFLLPPPTLPSCARPPYIDVRERADSVPSHCSAPTHRRAVG